MKILELFRKSAPATRSPVRPAPSDGKVYPWPYPWMKGEIIYLDSTLAISIHEGEPREDGGDTRRMDIGIRGSNAHTMYLNAETIDKLAAAFATAYKGKQ